MIGCILKINMIKYDPRTIECCDYKHNHDDLCNDIKNINWKLIVETSDVNEVLKYFNAKVSEVFNWHASTVQKNVKGRACKWLTRELKKEMNNWYQQLRKARKLNSENNWSNYKQLQNHNTLIRKVKTSYHQNLLTENETNPCKFWNAIKEINPTKPKPVGSVTTNKKDSKSTILRFRYFFKTAIKEIKEAIFPLINFAWKSKDDKCDSKHFVMGYVSKIFIEKELCNLKQQKATGIDNLPPGLLLVISTSTILTIWKHAKVAVVFKSGDSSEPGNYCPVLILPVLSKILEKATHKQLMEYLQTENLLCNQQCGFCHK